MSHSTKTILSLNINGSSEQKIVQLKKIAQDTAAYAILCQEFKAKDLPEALVAAFPYEKWSYEFTPFEISKSQGLLTLIRISKDITVVLEDLSDSELLLHKVTISSEAESLSFGNIYLKPSLDLEKSKLASIFNDFVLSVDFLYGDYNLNTGNRETLLQSILENNDNERKQLINFPTYKKPGQNLRANNLTDIVISRDRFSHDITDTNIFIGDHVVIMDKFNFALGVTDLNVRKKANHFFYDSSKLTKEIVSKAWKNLDPEPTKLDLSVLTRNLLEICRCRKKPETTHVNLEYKDGYEDSNEPLTEFWQDACDEISGLNDIGSVFKIINSFSKSQEIATSKKTVFTRNQKEKSLKKYKSRVSKINKLSKDQNFKYLRIMRNVSAGYRKIQPSFRFTSVQVSSELKKLNGKAKYGPDNFLHEFFPSDSEGIKKLTNLVNNIIFGNKQGIYIPEKLKNANLCFIPKSESTAETRPLLLNSRVMSLIDRLINSLLLKHIENSPSLKNRHAFRPYKGVENAFDQIIAKIENSKLAKEDVVLFQGDLSNAFNGVHHRLIVIKVYDLLRETDSAEDREINWILLFLKSWSARWVFFEKTSFRLVTGVPQGSPLSPSIFTVVFSWDWAEEDGIIVVFFADDFTLMISGKDWVWLNAKLNEILHDLEEWCLRYDFNLNAAKSKILIIGPNTSQNKLILDHEFKSIERVVSLRVLGLWFDVDFSFNWHFLHIQNYMKTRINALRSLRRLGLANKCLRSAALCLRSKLSFGLYHLMVISKTTFSKFEKIWIDICRAWTGATQLVPIAVMLKEAGTCTFERFIIYLLMARSLKPGELLPRNCFNPSSADLTQLPFSPRIPPTNRARRQSTIEKTNLSIQAAADRDILRLRKSSERFIMSVDESFKVIYAETLEKNDITKVKMKLKAKLGISGSMNKNMKEIFENLKNEKIERFGLFEEDRVNKDGEVYDC